MNTKRFALVLACLTLTASGWVAAQTNSANPNSYQSQPSSPSSQPASTVPSRTQGAMTTQTTDKSDQPVSDTWITTKVKSELATTKDVKSLAISVKTVDGVVSLSGTQPSASAVKKAISVAQNVKGVVRVDADNLKSRGATATRQ